MTRVSVAAVVVALTGCAPDVDDCSVECGAAGGCPANMTCGADRFCHAETTVPCALRGATDATVTPPPTDAMLSDAAPPVVCALAEQIADNDTCATAIDLTQGARAEGGVEIAGDTRLYTSSFAATSQCAAPTGPDALYTVTIEASERLEFQVEPATPTMDIFLWSFADLCSGGPSGCVPIDDNGPGEPEAVVILATVGRTQTLVVDSASPLTAGCYTVSARLTDQ